MYSCWWSKHRASSHSQVPNAAASSISSRPGRTAPLIHWLRKPQGRCINNFIWPAHSLRVNIKLVEVERSPKWSAMFIWKSLRTPARSLSPVTRRSVGPAPEMLYAAYSRMPGWGSSTATPATTSSPTTTLPNNTLTRVPRHPVLRRDAPPRAGPGQQCVPDTRCFPLGNPDYSLSGTPAPFSPLPEPLPPSLYAFFSRLFTFD